MALVAIIHFFLHTNKKSPRNTTKFLEEKWLSSVKSLFLKSLYIQLFTITVSKILVLLKVSAKTDWFQCAQDFTPSSSEFSWFSWGTLNCQFKPNTMECLWNTNGMWIPKVSWQSLKRCKEKLKLGLISRTVLACLSGQTAHTALRTRYSMCCRAQGVEQIHRESAFLWQISSSSCNGFHLFWAHKNQVYLLYQQESHVYSVPQASLAHVTEQWSKLVPVLSPNKIPVYIKGRWVCLYHPSLSLFKAVVKLVFDVTCIFMFWWFGEKKCSLVLSAETGS